MRTSTLDLICLTSLAAGLVYFSVDAWLGPSGGVHVGPLQRQIERLEADVQALEAERLAIERRNDALGGAAVDPELLDERLRAVFGVAEPRDALIVERR